MIDLNKEIKIILKEHYDYIILRHLTTTKCNCWRVGNTPNPQCTRCEGLGWLFTESIQKCKLFLIDSQVVSHTQDFDYGKSYSNSMTIYFPINNKTRQIKENDLLFSPKVKDSGELITPLIRTRKWIVTDNIEFKCCNGKPEFIKVLAKPVIT